MESKVNSKQLLAERQQKIVEYETFIEQKLQVDLQYVMAARDRHYDQLAKYLELKNNIILLQENNMKEIKTKINLGNDFYAQAKVPDTSRIFVHVGLGFHVEYTLAEAIKFIEVKEKSLTKYADDLTDKSYKIRTKIQLMLEGINELRKLPIQET